MRRQEKGKSKSNILTCGFIGYRKYMKMRLKKIENLRMDIVLWFYFGSKRFENLK